MQNGDENGVKIGSDKSIIFSKNLLIQVGSQSILLVFEPSETAEKRLYF
jgi:hypothetical protein